MFVKSQTLCNIQKQRSFSKSIKHMENGEYKNVIVGLIKVVQFPGICIQYNCGGEGTFIAYFILIIKQQKTNSKSLTVLD